MLFCLRLKLSVHFHTVPPHPHVLCLENCIILSIWECGCHCVIWYKWPPGDAFSRHLNIDASTGSCGSNSRDRKWLPWKKKLHFFSGGTNGSTSHVPLLPTDLIVREKSEWEIPTFTERRLICSRWQAHLFTKVKALVLVQVPGACGSMVQFPMCAVVLNQDQQCSVLWFLMASSPSAQYWTAVMETYCCSRQLFHIIFRTGLNCSLSPPIYDIVMWRRTRFSFSSSPYHRQKSLPCYLET